MQRNSLLVVTAVSEGVTGLMLLFVPSVVIRLLLGATSNELDAILISRIAGAALIAIAIVCWLARSDDGRPTQVALLTGVLFYDLAAAALLAYGGLVLSLVGVALWPAVLAHAALAVWCVLCLWR
jgi:hypothetical protein